MNIDQQQVENSNNNNNSHQKFRFPQRSSSSALLSQRQSGGRNLSLSTLSQEFIDNADADEVSMINSAKDQQLNYHNALLRNYQDSLQLLNGGDDQQNLLSADSQQLVKSIEMVLQNQNKVNNQLLQLSSSNYMVNIVNFLNNRRLNRHVSKISNELVLYKDRVNELETEVGDMSVGLAVQQKTTERLSAALNDTRQLLSNSIQEYRQEIARQAEQLQNQSSIIGRIYSTKFNQDIVTDGLVFLCSLYVVNSVIFRYPISVSTRLLVRQNQVRRQFLRQLARLIILALVMGKMKNTLVYYGLHNKVGGYTGYVRQLMLFIFRKLTQGR
ncbi:hypothetical protein MIR68_004658 [Amoeboaphelidium protococcarum]|nr:hypothetical protein MIR68_004658 [Amoeboaphelidium protococcarum]